MNKQYNNKQQVNEKVQKISEFQRAEYLFQEGSHEWMFEQIPQTFNFRKQFQSPRVHFSCTGNKFRRFLTLHTGGHIIVNGPGIGFILDLLYNRRNCRRFCLSCGCLKTTKKNLRHVHHRSIQFSVKKINKIFTPFGICSIFSMILLLIIQKIRVFTEIVEHKNLWTFFSTSFL